jgi:hypothetical protein
VDATLGDYPVLTKPTIAANETNKFEIKMWEIACSKYIEDKDKLEADKGKVLGLAVLVMLTRMSSSRTR